MLIQAKAFELLSVFRGPGHSGSQAIWNAVAWVSIGAGALFIPAAWGLAGQSGEPKVQYPPRDRELSLRDLVRGAFQGAFQGATEGMGSAVPRQGGLMFLAPNLVR